jgi:hypothetical protein
MRSRMAQRVHLPRRVMNLVQPPQKWDAVMQHVNGPFQQIAREEKDDDLLPERRIGEEKESTRADAVQETSGRGPENQRHRQVEQRAVDDGVG